jgi:hypothetical protein
MTERYTGGNYMPTEKFSKPKPVLPKIAEYIEKLNKEQSK